VIRTPFHQAVIVGAFALALSALPAAPASALEVLCDTAFENCRTRLLELIDNEQIGIDVGFWSMTDLRYVTHLVNRKNAGVRVRVIMDPRTVSSYPVNQTTFDTLAQAGIPLIKKSGGGIMHWKLMIFAGQNTIEFGAANYGAAEFVPDANYTNYISQSIYYTDDPSLVNSFKTKFDDLWVSTTTYSVYANVTERTRSYPIYPIDPDLNIPPGASFTNRLIKVENAETQKIDVSMYRITQQSHGDALIAAYRRGVPVRYLGETREYRLLSRLWVSYNMDRIYAAGIPMRVRAHDGNNHQKLVLLYGQGMSVFGSSNFTGPSDNSQQENNYFTKKSWMFQWFQEQYDRRWNNSTGNIETKPFVPLPPDSPVSQSIANRAIGVPTTGQKLVWYGGPWAHLYDIYFGTDPAATTRLAADQPLGPSETTTKTQSFMLPVLQPGTTYYWRIVAKTMALLEKSGPIWSFTTAGTTPPGPSPGAMTIVLWTSSTQPGDLHGNWTMLSDATASGKAALSNPNSGQAKIAPALAAPANYFERKFTVQPGVAYHLWVRLKAQSNALSNDSVHVQFTGSQDAAGTPMWQIGTTSSAEVVVQNGPNDGSIAEWGWSDNGWGTTGGPVYFAASGQTVRVQQREDGAIVDEIVLSPDTYLSSPPGPHDNDATILTENDGSGNVIIPPSSNGSGPPTIVLWSARAAPSGIVGTAWQPLPDGSAAGGSGLWNPDGARPKVAPALATPDSYVEMTFTATAGIPYHLWVRLRAQNNSLSNDSVHVQFDHSVDASGNPMMRIGSTASAEVVLQNGPSGSADQGWGWADNGWGAPGKPVYFSTTGVHTLRIQQREDGPVVDQIVLSPNKYLVDPPGPRQNDGTILDPS
jgi:phosphatidylserine/phosphatidylglycerophosphate/cardiolipin synthase-like enzyme